MKVEVEGKVIRFDSEAGYGFIRQHDGEDDVFFHVNDVINDERLIRVGSNVEFGIVDGDRGLRAVEVGIVRSEDDFTNLDYVNELTEGLIDRAPSLTLEQVRQIRDVAVDIAEQRGWIH